MQARCLSFLSLFFIVFLTLSCKEKSSEDTPAKSNYPAGQKFYLDNRVLGQSANNLSSSLNGDIFFSQPSFLETTGGSISLSLNYFEERVPSLSSIISGETNVLKFNYSETLDATKAFEGEKYNPVGLYTSPESACSEGWQKIKDQPFHGQLASYQAKFNASRGVCEVLDQKTVVSIFAIRTEQGQPYFNTHVLRLSNGTHFLFEKNRREQIYNNLRPRFSA